MRRSLKLFLLFGLALLTSSLHAEGPLTHIRIALIANDEDWEKIKTVLHQIEEAIEPPSDVEGFWKRKWQAIKNLSDPKDIIETVNFPGRIVPNLRRLWREAEQSPDPLISETLKTSAVMFAFTHGGEVVVGATKGMQSLAEGDLPAAAGWAGLAIPGLYDVGCLIGQGIVFGRPTRGTANRARRVVISIAGGFARAVGAPALIEALFEKPSARQAFLNALAQDKSQVLDWELSAQDIRIALRNGQGEKIAHLEFEERNESIFLKRVQVETEKLKEISPRELHAKLSGFGWDVSNAFLQIHKQIARDREHLIAHNGTFVSAVNDHTIEIKEGSVQVISRRKLRPLQQILPRLSAFGKMTCQNVYFAATRFAAAVP